MCKNQQLGFVFLVLMLLIGCRQEPVDCPPVPSAPRGQLNGLLPADAPIQFPLDDYMVRGNFAVLSDLGVFKNKRHAAEDVAASPGTAVAVNAIYQYRKKKSKQGETHVS